MEEFPGLLPHGPDDVHLSVLDAVVAAPRGRQPLPEEHRGLAVALEGHRGRQVVLAAPQLGVPAGRGPESQELPQKVVMKISDAQMLCDE